MPVNVGEETPETVETQIDLGRDLRRTHTLYHEGLVAIGPCLEAVGSRFQTGSVSFVRGIWGVTTLYPDPGVLPEYRLSSQKGHSVNQTYTPFTLFGSSGV